MPKIETGVFSSFLRRYLKMKGTTEVADELSPEISPTMALEVERPEWEFLKGARLMACLTSLDDVAFQVLRVRNPATSGCIGIFTNFTVSVDAITAFSLTREATTTDLSSVVGSIARDTRLPTIQGSAFVCSRGSEAAPTGTAWYTSRLAADIPTLVPVPFVLTPGHAVQIVISTAGIRFDVTTDWLEKRLDDLETQ